MRNIRNLILELSVLLLVFAGIAQARPGLISFKGAYLQNILFANDAFAHRNLFAGFPSFAIDPASQNFSSSVWSPIFPFYDSGQSVAQNQNSDPDPTLVDKVSPAVVSVFGRAQVEDGLNVPGVSMTAITAGTGFFVNPNGYILTNRHVVENLDSDYSVTLSDGTSKDAVVTYRDPANDLAVLKIEGTNYPVLSLGDSSSVKVGQSVFAIGNAFGRYAGTVSSGSVTALKKQIVAMDDAGPETLNNVIRTDVQLYPGDSGGPLIDMSGNVVGIDVAASQSSRNLSFSIPINDANTVIATATTQSVAEK